MLQAQLGEERRANTIGVTFRRKTDTFYHDYLHRGSLEYVNESTYVQTPLAMMSYMEYGAFVSVVPGDPWALQANQYAFEDHHDKFETHVQEIRPSPVVPYVHGFTMPTKEKDIETSGVRRGRSSTQGEPNSSKISAPVKSYSVYPRVLMKFSINVIV